MTLAMLGLAGIPATAGFVGKFYLIDASVDGGYTWLGVVIVVGSMISLAYYLRVVSAMWLGEAPERPAQPALAGAAPEGDPASAHWEVYAVAVIAGAATLFFGIIPSPLFDFVRHAGAAMAGLF
jgi:NADH-quinone oxidoreductase subunit N